MRLILSFLAAAGLLISATYLFAQDRAKTAGATKAGAGRSVKVTKNEKLPYGMPIIDAHVHLDFDGKEDPASHVVNTKEGFLKEAQALGIKGFVCHTKNDEVATPDMAPLKGAFCAGIREKFEIKRVEDGLKNGKYKCIKIYLGYVYHYPNDEMYKPLYTLAAKYKVPVVFHTGDTVTADGKIKYSHPLGIDEVAVEHRDVTFVIAHLGNPWISDAAEVIYKNPNVYGDISALMIGDLKRTPKDDLKKLVIEPVSFATSYIENADKLMFGTDWPLIQIKQYLDVVIKAIPKKDQDKFLYKNAEKIFGLNVE